MNRTQKDRQILFNKYEGKCAYCGDDLKKGWHVDHIEPIEKKLARWELQKSAFKK